MIREEQDSMIFLKETLKKKILHGRLRRTELFDPAWYSQKQGLPEGVSPYEHYLEGGWKTCDPSPLFSHERYLEVNADVAAAGLCPLEHYLLRGRKEHRKLFRGQVRGRRWRYAGDAETREDVIPEGESGTGGTEAAEEELLVSVIIPTFNRAASIKQSCLSVLGQTYRRIELIVVDDCSEDETEQAVRSIEDPRVRYLRHEKNLGACAARNTGIRAAGGAYIAFQDSDDLWLPGKLKAQMKAIRETGCDICFCGYLRREKDDIQVRGPSCYFRPGIQKRNLETVFGIGTQTLVIRREVLLKDCFDPGMPRFQDLELLLRLVHRYRVFYCDEALVIYQTGKDSISRNTGRLIGACRLLLEKHGDIRQAYPLLCRELAGYLLFEAEREPDALKRREMGRLALKYDLSRATAGEALGYCLGLRKAKEGMAESSEL